MTRRLVNACGRRCLPLRGAATGRGRPPRGGREVKCVASGTLVITKVPLTGDADSGSVTSWPNDEAVRVRWSEMVEVADCRCAGSGRSEAASSG